MLVAALLLALTMSFGGVAAFADPDCAPPTKPSCHDGGKPGPSNFVGPGGGSKKANH